MERFTATIMDDDRAVVERVSVHLETATSGPFAPWHGEIDLYSRILLMPGVYRLVSEVPWTRGFRPAIVSCGCPYERNHGDHRPPAGGPVMDGSSGLFFAVVAAGVLAIAGMLGWFLYSDFKRK
jgi:hypothetical protein